MLQSLVALRMLISSACAFAMLYCFSYIDSIIPVSYELDQSALPLSIYGLREYLWVLPWILMEVFCVMGTRRNLVWFTGLLVVIIGGFLLWPILQVWRPELVVPTFEFEDGKLSYGLGCMVIFLMVSALFRLVLLNFFFSAPPEAAEESMVEAEMLDPSKGRTLREIQAEPLRQKHHFLFGGPDENWVERVTGTLQRLIAIQRLRWVLLGLALLLGLLWFYGYPRLMGTAEQRIARDQAMMFDYVQTPQGYYATKAAVHAAYREMRRLSVQDKLTDLSREQARELFPLAGVPEAYRKQLLDNSDLPTRSAEDIFINRERFLTVTDGHRRTILFIRTDESDKIINISEVQDEGWNPVVDEQRRRIGASWRRTYRL